MAMRLSGLMSGMDTESVIEQLVMARRAKVDDVKKAQTKLQWKTDAWKTLNSKILKLYNGILGSTMRFEGSYMKKITKVSNSSVVSVITGDSAMNSVQSLKVNKLAKSAYLTGGQVGDGEEKGKLDLDSDSRLSKLGYTFADSGKIKVTVGDKETEINVTGATTMGELAQAFKDAGLNASFDAENQRFYVASKETGAENDFSIYAGDAKGMEMLQKLGLSYMDESVAEKYQNYIDTQNNSIEARYDYRLEELTAEKKNLEQLIKDRIETIKEKSNGVISDTDDIETIQAKVQELYDADPEAYEELNDLAGGLSSLSNRLKNVNDGLEEDDEGNYSLAQSEKDQIDQNVQEMIQPFKDVLEKLEKDGEGKYIFEDDPSGAKKDAGANAEIELNGAIYTSSKNTFVINGLTMTVNSTTAEGEVVTLTTQDDTDGIYDMIKSFIKEYSELINEMDKLYNAESSRGYEPLTSEEKEAMSESEIEEWETKIKDALLRKDDTLGTLSSALKQLMLEGVTVNGKKMYLTNFGIETLSYFTAAENEKNAYHIDGDTDDPNTASKEDKLRAMIASDPQTVIDFFVGLSRNMYAEMTTRMARTEYSSAYTAYEDVRMKKEYEDYTSKIKELEKKLSDYEDKWYQKFAQMETALAKLQSSASAVTSLLGG